jgi:hypothetical protein
VHARRAQRVGQGRSADQFQRGIDAVRVQLAHGGRDPAGVEQGMVDTLLLQPREASGLR